MSNATQKEVVKIKGREVVFYPKSHRYKIDGEWVKSVTSVVNQLNKGDSLNLWYGKKAVEAVVEMFKLWDTVTDQDILQRYDAGSKARDEKADFGNRVHEAVSHYIREVIKGNHEDADKILNCASDEDKHVSNAITSFRMWEDSFEPEYMNEELVTLYSDEGIIAGVGDNTSPLLYVGTLDIKCKINGETYIVDMKTSKHIYESHKIQVCAYGKAEDTKNTMVLKLPGTDDDFALGFQTWKCPDDETFDNLFNIFVNLFHISHCLKSVK